MLRLLSRGRKGQEGGEDDHKKYKKANLGKSNQMYYNDELKMWVERGKEDEARAEKEKLNAPPPSVGSLSAASSTTSLATMSDAAGPAPAPNFSRPKSLVSRYVATPTLAIAPTAGGAGSTPGSSPAIPGPKALLPGMGGPKLPGIPAAPGSGPPSFFRPTPAASEATSDAMGGSELGSVSGLSGLDAPGSFSRNTSQPNFFIPGAAPSSSTTTEDTQGAGGAGEEGARVSSGSGGTAATEQPQREPSEAAGSFRESDASASGRLPALSGPSNVSFASWQHISRDSAGTGSPAAATAAPPVLAVAAAGGVGEEPGLGLQGSSSPDTEPDAQAEVSSSTPELYPGKQQVPHVSAYSNGNGAAYGAGPYVPAVAGGELLANGNHRVDGVQPGGEEQPPLATQLSAGWDSRPVKDPFDTEADPGMLAEPVSNGWALGQDGYEVEGGAVQQPDPLAAGGASNGWVAGQDGYGWGAAGGWEQPQDPLKGGAVQQPDPLAAGGAEGGWGVQPDGQAAWVTPAPEAGVWGDGSAAAGVEDPEGGSGAGTAVSEGTGFQAAAAGSQYQPGYYGSYGDQQYAPATDGTAAAFGSYDDQQYPQAAHGTAAGFAQQPYMQQPYSGDTSSVPAEGGFYYPQQPPGQDQDGAAAYAGYGVPAVSTSQAQDAAGVLQPVHPELPGISVAGVGSGSLPSPTYPHPGPAPGSSRSSKAAMRHTSMPGSPLTHQSSMGALLPGPPRHSVSGLSTQRSLGLQDSQGEAAALVLSTTAAAGDASMLTTFRPSSPYARAVSPLSRTSTGVGDAAAVTKQSSGGFPIPSPPGHAGMLGGRPQSGGMFLPGGVSAAQAAAGATVVPWQPGSTAGVGSAHGAGHTMQQPLQEHPLMNGYDPAAQSHWAHQHQPYDGQGYQAPGTPQQQHFGEQPSPQQAAGGCMAGSGPPSQAPPVPPFVPGLLESLPRDAPPTWPRDETAPYAPEHQQATAAAGSKGLEGLQQQHPVVAAARAHPYDQFLSQALSQVNWRAVHFKQPGKLNRMLPWEEFEMEQALRQEAERQAAGQGRTSPFWCRQMEFRQKLPPGSMKPSASEPAAMPSHAATKAPPPSAAVSDASQISAYPGWPQVQEQQHQMQQYQAHALQQPHGQQQLVPGSPLTPAKAATDGALGAVAAGGAHLFHEEPTPTSKLMQPSEQPAAAVGVDGEQQGMGEATAAAVEQQQQPGWEGYGGEQQAAANGYWTQDEYGQPQYVQQPYDQYYGQQQYDQYGQQYSVDHPQQQYDMSQWQQQQPADQQYAATSGEAAAAGGADQAAVQEAGVPGDWSVQAGQQATWGSPEPQPDTQQQHLCYPAAAVEPLSDGQQLDMQQPQDYVLAGVEEAAGAWGVDETLDLQLGVVAVDGAADAAAALAAAAVAASVVDAAHPLHPPEVVSAALAARISTSSLGLESQPSNRPLGAAVDGWEGGEVTVDGQESVGEVDAAPEHQQEPGAEDVGEAGAEYGEAAAPPVSAAWLKLAQQFLAAADAAAAMGSLDPGLIQYKEYFVEYGDYLLNSLPREALEQAGLLADDTQAAGDAEPEAVDGRQGEDEEEQEELYAEFGNLQLRDDTSAGLFASLGFDIDSLMACCAEA